MLQPLFCDNMDNFVHNTANKMSEFLQYVLVLCVQEGSEADRATKCSRTVMSLVSHC